MFTDDEIYELQEFYKVLYTNKSMSQRLSHSWWIVWLFAVTIMVPIKYEFEEPNIYLAIVASVAIIYSVHFLKVAQFYTDNLKTRRTLNTRIEFIRHAMFLEMAFFTVLAILMLLFGFVLNQITISFSILTFSIISLPIFAASLIVSWIKSTDFLKYHLSNQIEKNRSDRRLLFISTSLAAVMFPFIRLISPQATTLFLVAISILGAGYLMGYGMYIFRSYKSFSIHVA